MTTRGVFGGGGGGGGGVGAPSRFSLGELKRCKEIKKAFIIYLKILKMNIKKIIKDEYKENNK